MILRALVVLALAATLAACDDDSSGPVGDLATASDLGMPSDLADSVCPPTPPQDRSPCRGRAVCRYPTDASPNAHFECVGNQWDPGDCPWGPYSGSIPDYACTSGCVEIYGEAYINCSCPNGRAVCCIDTGGIPNCNGPDGGP
jgi:hypothetical protein